MRFLRFLSSQSDVSWVYWLNQDLVTAFGTRWLYLCSYILLDSNPFFRVLPHPIATTQFYEPVQCLSYDYLRTNHKDIIVIRQ